MKASTTRANGMGHAGLTLLEVVIAVAILAIGALAAAGLQASGLRATRAAQDMQRLNTVARSQVDVWRGANLTGTVPSASDCSTSDIACIVEIRPCALSGSLLACDLTSVAQPVAHAISVEVSSAERQLTLTTVVLR